MEQDYLTIEEINRGLRKPINITEDWITKMAKRKHDIEEAKQVKNKHSYL